MYGFKYVTYFKSMDNGFSLVRIVKCLKFRDRISLRDSRTK